MPLISRSIVEPVTRPSSEISPESTITASSDVSLVTRLDAFRSSRTKECAIGLTIGVNDTMADRVVSAPSVSHNQLPMAVGASSAPAASVASRRSQMGTPTMSQTPSDAATVKMPMASAAPASRINQPGTRAPLLAPRPRRKRSLTRHVGCG